MSAEALLEELVMDETVDIKFNSSPGFPAMGQDGGRRFGGGGAHGRTGERKGGERTGRQRVRAPKLALRLLKAIGPGTSGGIFPARQRSQADAALFQSLL